MLSTTTNIINHNKRVQLSCHRNILTQFHMLHIHTLCTLTFIWVNLEMIASLSMREASCESVMTVKILVHFRDCKNTISLQTQWHDSELDSLFCSDASF